MQLIARVNIVSDFLVDRAKARGLEAKKVKRATIIELAMIYSTKELVTCFTIPTELLSKHDYLILLDVRESGGGFTNSGKATIVAGLSGKALPPYFTPTRRDKKSRNQAYFSIQGGCITVEAFCGSEVITIYEHKVSIDRVTASITTKKLWSGLWYELPKKYHMYSKAAKAANEKAHTYLPHEPMYVAK